MVEAPPPPYLQKSASSSANEKHDPVINTVQIVYSLFRRVDRNWKMVVDNEDQNDLKKKFEDPKTLNIFLQSLESIWKAECSCLKIGFNFVLENAERKILH